MRQSPLCKILCHNVCCLIQSIFELGIEATFWGEAEDQKAIEAEPMEADEAVEAWGWV